MREPDRQPLNRARILDTAIAIADAEGIAALSMRRIGSALGVQAMSLYNHVANKADLLDGVVGTLLARMSLPDDASADWRENARAVCHAYRQVAHDHPALYPLVMERPLAAPEALDPLERVMNLMLASGLGEQDVLYAFQAFASYVTGFAFAEIVERGHGPTGTAVPLMPVLDVSADTRPATARVFRHAPGDPDAMFAFGLDLLIGALDARIVDRT